MRVPIAVPRGRPRWAIAALAISLAVITMVTVTLVTRRRDDASAIAAGPVEPAAPPTPSAQPPTVPTSSPPTGGPPQAGSSTVAVPATPPSPGERVAPAPINPLGPGERVAPAPINPPGAGERVAPAPINPPAPEPDRGDRPAAAGRDGSRAAPQPPSAASAPHDSAPRSQDGDTVDVAIDSTPPGAQLVLRGVVLGTTPYHGTLPRDDREARLVVRLTGYADKAVVVRASQPIAEHVTLVRKAPASPGAEGAKGSRDRSINPF